jgi:hypothetical protein
MGGKRGGQTRGQNGMCTCRATIHTVYLQSHYPHVRVETKGEGAVRTLALEFALEYLAPTNDAETRT